MNALPLAYDRKIVIMPQKPVQARMWTGLHEPRKRIKYMETVHIAIETIVMSFPKSSLKARDIPSKVST